MMFWQLVKFLLTRLMRGVTEHITPAARMVAISTHTPHARRDLRERIKTADRIISTHTPHARRDYTENGFINCENEFLLTRLMRGVTESGKYINQIISISTHTPHARRDRKSRRYMHSAHHFYSHASCEA